MKYYKIIFFLLLLSCSDNNSKNVDRIEVTYQIIVDSIMTRMPGILLINNDRIIMEDPFDANGFAKIYSNKGVFLGSFGVLGKGNGEFITPDIVNYTKDCIVVRDLNRDNTVIYSTQLLDTIETKIKHTTMGVTNLAYMDDNKYITTNSSDSGGMFKLFLDNKSIYEFGDFPYGNEFINKHSINQGRIFYNRETKQIIYSSFSIPYFAVYQYDGQFTKKTDKLLGDVSYSKKDKKFEIEDMTESPITEYTITRNYIVGIQRTKEDEANLPPKKRGENSLSRLPQTLFIYDYDLNLLKILDLHMPILRVAGDIYNDNLYMIGIKDGEYNISIVDHLEK